MSEVQLSEAVPLAHALVGWLAAENDVRVLFIKGPGAAAQGLRSARTSVDVDALVDPARRERLAARLSDLGWVDERPYTSPTVLPMHSTTHRHPAWVCELDLHDRFPGFFADPQDVFERLWRRHTTVEIAGRDLTCPDRAGQALVLAMHALRDPHDPHQAEDLSALVERVRADAEPEFLHDLARLAQELGAADTAAPFLDSVGAPALGRGSTSTADLRAWRLRTQPEASVAGWLDELRALPLRRRPGFLWYAAVLTESELRLDDPNLPPGRRAVLGARVRRLRRGLQALPAAQRGLAAVSSTTTADTAPSPGGRIVVRTTWRSRRVPGAALVLASAAIATLDRLVVPKCGVVIRTFPDFDDQGLETAAALARAGIGPVTWLVKDPAAGTAVGDRVPRGTRVVEAGSLPGLWAYLRARVVVHTHGLYGVPGRSPRKTFVNLWHGWGSKELQTRPDVAMRQSDLVTVPSDAYADDVATAWGVAREQVVATGLPRNDLLVRAARTEPPAAVRRLRDGRPLVLWLPTYRSSHVGEIRADGHEFDNDFQLPGANRADVEAMARAVGAHVLVKTHPMAVTHEAGDSAWLSVWDQERLVDSGLRLYELLGCADVLVTDYSSVWVDHLLVDRPIVFATPDSDEYAGTRGLYAPGLLDHLPGPTVRDLEGLGDALADALERDSWGERRRELRDEHHTHVDGDSADRVVAALRSYRSRRGRQVAG